MPVITFEMTQLNRGQKEELVAAFTESASEITGLPKESFYVFVKENALENVAVGGRLLDENFPAKS